LINAVSGCLAFVVVVDGGEKMKIVSARLNKVLGAKSEETPFLDCQNGIEFNNTFHQIDDVLVRIDLAEALRHEHSIIPIGAYLQGMSLLVKI
jgi:hypothetical protein